MVRTHHPSDTLPTHHPSFRQPSVMTSVMNYLRRTLGWAAIPNVTLWMIALQVGAYLLLNISVRGGNREVMIDRFLLEPDRVLAGEWWRLLSFVFLPPLSSPLWAFLTWMFFHLMGTTLEAYWGTFEFNLYLWIWWLATVVIAMVTQLPFTSNGYLYQSVFLAFAWLFPDFIIRLFFILPVKVRWIAWFDWFMLAILFAAGDASARMSIGAAIANFLIFFGVDIRDFLLRGPRKLVVEPRRVAKREPDYFHKCIVCGETDRSRPEFEFRYCSQCAGQRCYCGEHLRNHEHIGAAAPPPAGTWDRFSNLSVRRSVTHVRCSDGTG